MIIFSESQRPLLTFIAAALNVTITLGCSGPTAPTIDPDGGNQADTRPDTNSPPDAARIIDAHVADVSMDTPITLDIVEADANSDDAGPARSALVLGELLAFPTAHGYGRFTEGGRGGQIIRVTNTEARGPGSLREALQTSGPRVIVFDVAGDIDYGSTIFIRDDRYSVLGQTAPGDGIAVHSETGGIESRAGEAIWRHIRFRGSGRDGDSSQSNLRLIARSRNSALQNVIVDHCSFSWASSRTSEFDHGNEMNIGLAGDGPTGGHPDEITSRITLQRSILGEATRGVLLYKGTHSMSLFQNLWVGNRERNPLSNYPDDVPSDVQRFESINNIVHHARGRISVCIGDKFRVSDNVFTLGATQDPPFVRNIVQAQGDPNIGAGTPANTYAFIDNNLIPSADNINNSRLAPYLQARPYEETDIRGDIILDPSTLNLLLPYLGAIPSGRDSVDAGYVQRFVDRAGGDFVFDGTVPTLSSGPARVDANENFIDDAFEAEHAITDPSDAPEFFELEGRRWDNRERTGGTMTRGGYVGGMLSGETLYTWQEIYWQYLAGDFDANYWD